MKHYQSEQGFYPPSQKTTGLPMDECTNAVCATARCRPNTEANNRVVAEGEDGYLNGITDLPVRLHFWGTGLLMV